MSTEPIAPASDALTVPTERRVIRPGTRAFTLLLSGAMAMTALAIDTLLPAFDEVRAEFGLASDATDVAALVTTFFVGFGIGQLPAGVLADRYGRRPVLWGGLAIYVIGASAAALAPSLGVMIAARFLWGLGAAGPRVAVTAMVRDSYSGAAMARQMSSIMAVFLLIPMVAPALGAALMALGPWQLTIWLCVAMAALVFTASTFLEPTLPAAERRAVSAREVVDGWRMVVTAPGTLGYMACSVVMMATFLSFVASSENILDETFGLKSWFAPIFAVLAGTLALAQLTNGRVVERLGLRHLLTVVPIAQIGLTTTLCALALATGGRPPFAVFLPLLVLTMTTQQITLVNANAAAMVPLGHVAGSAAAVMGAAPQIVGGLLASQIDARFDGTIRPLSIAFVISSVLALICVRYALRVTSRVERAA